jgi:hypothetical protein
MNTYELHEYAEIFPAMSVTEVEQLEEGIKAKGLQHKITLYQRKILDGRHRYEICKKLGLEADFQEYNGDAPLGYVVTATGRFSSGIGIGCSTRVRGYRQPLPAPLV